MSQVNITQAAQLAGISRSHFHRHYVKTGKLAVTKDEKGRPQIDTSELLRVFGTLNATPQHTKGVIPTAHTITPDHTPSHSTPNATPQHTPQEVELLRQQLREAKEREQEYRDREAFYQKQIQELTGTLKLLEHQPAPARPNRRWWQFMWK